MHIKIKKVLRRISFKGVVKRVGNVAELASGVVPGGKLARSIVGAVAKGKKLVKKAEAVQRSLRRGLQGSGDDQQPLAVQRAEEADTSDTEMRQTKYGPWIMVGAAVLILFVVTRKS